MTQEHDQKYGQESPIPKPVNPEADDEVDAAIRASYDRTRRKLFKLPENATDEEVDAAIQASYDRNRRSAYRLPQDATDEQVDAVIQASYDKERSQAYGFPVSPRKEGQTTPKERVGNFLRNIAKITKVFPHK